MIKSYNEYEKLHNDLTICVLTDLKQSYRQIEALKMQDSFNNDARFQLVVNTNYAMIKEIQNDYEEAILIVNNNILAATNLTMWPLLAFNYNTLGNIYAILYMLDKSLEAYTMVINIEKKYNLTYMTAVAYNNIGLIYRTLDDDDTSIVYFQRAFQSIDAYEKKHERYISKSIHIMSNYIIDLCKKNQLKKAKIYMNKIDNMMNRVVDQYTLCVAKEAKIYYSFYNGQYEDGKKHFKCIHKIFTDINTEEDFFRIVANYGELCQKFNLDFNFYIPELLKIETLRKNQYPDLFTRIYLIILLYYQSISDTENINKTFNRYIHYAELNRAHSKQQRLNSLNIVLDSVNTKEKNYAITKKNKQLELMTKRLKTEITAHKDTQKKLQTANVALKKLSSLDGLTQVYNRRKFETTYIKLIKKAYDKNLPISVFMIDIDCFKSFNDSYGHLEGDHALKIIAQNMKQSFEGENALFARFGGEEFIAVIIGLDKEKSIQLAQQLRITISKLRIINQNVPLGFLTVSIGVAISKTPSTTIKSDLMKQADLCLYKAKNRGRNRVESNLL